MSRRPLVPCTTKVAKLQRRVLVPELSKTLWFLLLSLFQSFLGFYKKLLCKNLSGHTRFFAFGNAFVGQRGEERGGGKVINASPQLLIKAFS